MSHYDCKNCGHYLGINFGHCEACTPQEYFDLQNQIKNTRGGAAEAWDEKSEEARKLFMKEYLDDAGYDHMINRLAGLKKTHFSK